MNHKSHSASCVRLHRHDASARDHPDRPRRDDGPVGSMRRRRTRRDNSTTGRAVFEGSPRGSPPTPPGDRARSYRGSPRCPPRLVAAAVDEVGAEDAVTLAEERVGAVPVIHAEVGVEVVGERVPRDLLPIPCVASDPGSRPRGARETKARVVSRAFRWAGCATWSTISSRRPTHALLRIRATLGVGRDVRRVEGAVDDELATALEQIGEARRPPSGPRSGSPSRPPSMASAAARRRARRGRA